MQVYMHHSLSKVANLSLIYRVNESLVSQLESEIHEAKLQLEGLNKKLLSEMHTSANLQASIDMSVYTFPVNLM